jgi:hypothetical protein
MQHPRQSDRFVRELEPLDLSAGAGGVPLVEDQIGRVPNGCEPTFVRARIRQLEARARLRDRSLRAADPLRHRRLGDQERARDLGGRQAADRPQSESDLRWGRQRLVAAQEKQPERVVVSRCILACSPKRVPLFASAPGGVAAELVDQPARGGREEPRTPVLGNARPATA